MYEERLWAVAERLRHVSLDQRDGVAAIRMYGREPSNLLYIDPPYIRKDRYRYSVDHEVLLKAVSEARAHIVISGYASQLYDTYLKDWERHVFPTFAGGRGTKIVPREEIVWVKC
jgi:DNA adenine methylase